jgi:hypothetical protein
VHPVQLPLQGLDQFPVLSKVSLLSFKA